MSDLVLVTSQKEIEKIFLSDGLTKKIEDIKRDALAFVADVNTPGGRKACASKARDVAKQKVVIDNAGKDLKNEYKIKVDKIDAVRKAARDTLDEVRDTVRKPLTEWEAEEARRVEEERLAVELEMAMEEAAAENELFDRQKEVERREAELAAKEKARIAKEEAEREEKERVEREKRIAQEAKEQAEREAQEKIEAERRAKIEAELKAKQDAERAEREKKDAIEKARREEQERLQNIENAKKEKEKIEREMAEKKARNVAHQRKVNREAVDCFVSNGIEEESAKQTVSLIAKNKIKNITINY